MSKADLIPFQGTAPAIAEDAFVAPGSRVIGRVKIAAQASVWYNCVVRGDVNDISIGARTNIQDGTVIHCDSPEEGDDGYPTIIGEDCLVGHMVLLHGCILKDRAFVGMGAIVLNGAVIESDGMLAAGAMLTAGKTVRSGELWAGRPAKYLRDLRPEEIAANQEGVRRYVANAALHKAEITGG